MQREKANGGGRGAYEASVEAAVAIVKRGVDPALAHRYDDHQWFVAHTHPCQETAVLGRLLELGLEAVCPRIPQMRQRAVQPWREAVRYVPLYPCYLFVPFDLDGLAWRVALTLPGMRRFLGEGFERPTPIPYDFVEFSQAVAAARVMEVESNGRRDSVYHRDDKVVVLKGPFAEHTGIVDMPGATRVAILLSVFGRTVRTEVRAKDLRLSSGG